MSGSVDRFEQCLRDLAAPMQVSKLDVMLKDMADNDPDLHEVVVRALTGRDSKGAWQIPTAHVADALTKAGYPISHDTVRRWRRNVES